MKKKPLTFIIYVLIISAFIFVIPRLCINKNKIENIEEIKVEENDIWPPGLKKENVSLEENLFKNNYYIIFDGSGSMEGNKIITAKKALIEFVKYVPADANLGLAIFDGKGLSERAPLGSDRNVFIEKIKQTKASNGTPLSDALELAYTKIIEQARRQLGYGEYNIVVVTDGEANEGYEPDEIVDLILKESPVALHTIGFQISKNHSLNQPGKIDYKSANNFEELSQGLEEVLAESEFFDVSDFKKQ